MNVWTYRRPFTVQGEAFTVLIETGFKSWRSRLMRGPQELTRDETTILGASLDYRNHRLRQVLPDGAQLEVCLLYTSPSPRDRQKSRMPSSA